MAGVSPGVRGGRPGWIVAGVSPGVRGGRPGWIASGTRSRLTLSVLSKGTWTPRRQGDLGSGSSVGVLVAGIAGEAGVLGVRRAVRSVPRATNTAFFCSGVRDCQSLYLWYFPGPVPSSFTGVVGVVSDFLPSWRRLIFVLSC